MLDLRTLLERTSALHSHLCPRQVLGVRTGMYAAEILGLDLPQEDKRLYAFVETDGCFADGVSVATGCWLGHRTLRLVDYGKVAATFADTQTGRAVRISPSPQSRKLALEYMPDLPNHWHAQLQAYQIMPAKVLLSARPVKLLLSVEALVSRPGLRATCARCGDEIMNEREVVQAGQALCRHCAGDQPYYCDDADAGPPTDRK
jgi:formylmethanofuran dehydrogenase subunit E